MAQDLREMFKEEKENRQYALKEGHEQRFLKLLNKEFPDRGRVSFFRYGIAAGILMFIGLSWFAYHVFYEPEPVKTTIVDTKNGEEQEDGEISFGDLSPDLKKVEEYYTVNINLELSKLEVSEDNKALVDSFMERLAELNREYARLNKELNEIGPNDQTISALVKNLQLRLELLQKLKKKLNDLKSSENEQVTTNTV